MKRAFVDTNVFLRFLTQDDERQSERAAALFRAAVAGEIGLVTGPPVVFELVWTLRRAYKVSRARTLEIVASLLAMDGLAFTDRGVLEAALERARDADQELADAYIAAAAADAGADEVATFNEHDFVRLGCAIRRWDG